jgi:hypothetical protein
VSAHTNGTEPIFFFQKEGWMIFLPQFKKPLNRTKRTAKAFIVKLYASPTKAVNNKLMHLLLSHTHALL